MVRGRLALCGATPAVRQVIEIAGFDSILSVYPDRAVAEAQMCRRD
jgi:anti-anti-sigma regulatory factor